MSVPNPKNTEPFPRGRSSDGRPRELYRPDSNGRVRPGCKESMRTRQLLRNRMAICRAKTMLRTTVDAGNTGDGPVRPERNKKMPLSSQPQASQPLSRATSLTTTTSDFASPYESRKSTPEMNCPTVAPTMPSKPSM
eukprot:scaffold617_cov161-Pinguiococcus_pyrenoidosus.AAC.6